MTKQPADAAFESVQYTLSTVPPLGSLVGVDPVTLLVGLDENGPDGALKVYLGARYKRVYLLIAGEAEKEQFRRAWGSGGHVWMWPVPHGDLLHVDPAPGANAPSVAGGGG